MTAEPHPAVSQLRRFLLFILVLGMLGIAAELWITEHTEDFWQWVPLALILAALASATWCAAQQSAASLRTLQVVMALFIVSGFTGITLHMQAKMEFKKESDPSLSGWKLLVGSLESKTPPPLAPGMMIQLGLLGLAYVYRHPALAEKANTQKSLNASSSALTPSFREPRDS